MKPISKDDFLTLIELRKEIKGKYVRISQAINTKPETKADLLKYFKKQIKCLDVVIGIVRNLG